MEALTLTKMLITSAFTVASIAFVFMAISPPIWFLTFAGSGFIWLFGEGVMRGATSFVQKKYY